MAIITKLGLSFRRTRQRAPIPLRMAASLPILLLSALLTTGTNAAAATINSGDQEKADTLSLYAPRISFVNDERYYPANVAWSFANMTRVRRPDGNFSIQLKVGLNQESDTQDWFHGIDPKGTQGLTLGRVPVYAFWAQKSPAIVDLVYATYYPYNNGKTVLSTQYGNHVGDWEFVRVRLTADANGHLQATALITQAHGNDTWTAWSDAVKVDNSQHPFVYAAAGSHGYYTTPGKHYYGPSIVGLADTTGDAANYWDTWTNVITYDYNQMAGLPGARGPNQEQYGLTSANQWPFWMSTHYSDQGVGTGSGPAAGPIFRWGDPASGCFAGQCRLDDGPTGPADKSILSEAPQKPRSATAFQSVNFPDHFVRHQSFLGELTVLNTALDHEDSAFHVVPGLLNGGSWQNGCVSFQSVGRPWRFLRHANFRIHLDSLRGDGSDGAAPDTTYYADATFCARPGRSNPGDPGLVSYEAVNFPGYFLRHASYHLYLDPNPDIADSTFRVQELP